ncbi:MAG: glycoside hydrolase family 99-like domain-containing protein [Bacteroidetes bacterium]|nr:glycoside hydrolase family 99-like domain-containing protein [Bacteroidota bacterium]
MDVQLIAFYLPQFHPIPENDQWWGKGFTEWTNVTRAKPLYKGHYQPHLPADLGFYDLRNPETREAQADLAKLYGISGFCYWHYWFNGKRLLERPFEEVLESGKPDFPFCLAWANEPWSRRWHGLEQDVLQPQTYGGEEDDERHIQWLVKAFKDKRYIKLDGKPLFLIYNPAHLPSPECTIERWRKCVQKAGFDDLFIVAIKSHEKTWTKSWKDSGFDHELIFQPNFGIIKDLHTTLQSFSILPTIYGRDEVDPIVVPYNVVWKDFAAFSLQYPSLFTTVVPQWDNSPRRKYQPVILEGPSPIEYEKWLTFDIDRARVEKRPFVFVNAWNEWAEGNHLEPDQQYGHAFLQATYNALSASPERIIECICDVVIAILHNDNQELANKVLIDLQNRFGSTQVKTQLSRKLKEFNLLSKNREAVELFRAGQLQKAISIFEDLFHHSNHPLIIRNLACSYYEQQQYETALQLLTSQKEATLENPFARLLEAECREHLGDLSGALRIYGELLTDSYDELRCMQRIQRLVVPEEKTQNARQETLFTSIIVVTFNNLHYTRECLASILEHTTPPYELIVIDNASSDGTPEWLEEFCSNNSQCKCVLNPSNIGFPKAVNQGLRIARGDAVVLVNNDVVVTEGWLNGLLRIATEYESIGLVGPMTNYISGSQKDRTAWYSTRQHMLQHARKTRELYRNVMYEATRIRFFCVLITKKALELCGGLDERFTPGNCEDDDYCLRVQKAGLRVVIARDVFVHHYGSKAFSSIGKGFFEDILFTNIERFREKWGISVYDIGMNNPHEKHYPLKYPVSSNRLEEAIERALMHVQANEMIQAAKLLDEALELMNSSDVHKQELMSIEDLYNIAGKVFLSIGNLERAKELFELELRMNPTSARACAGLGKTFYAASLYEASKTMYEYACVYDVTNNSVREELGKVNEILGLSREHNSLVQQCDVLNEGTNE